MTENSAKYQIDEISKSVLEQRGQGIPRSLCLEERLNSHGD